MTLKTSIYREVRYKQRKKPEEHKVDAGCMIGRIYQDYLNFMEDNDNPSSVQIDTVKDTKTGKVLLSIHFVSCSFMQCYLREENTSKSVTDIFINLYAMLGQDLFVKLFPVILTDNGTGFSNYIEIEFNQETDERFYFLAKFYEDKGGDLKTRIQELQIALSASFQAEEKRSKFLKGLFRDAKKCA